jgi:hypothetical protein
LLQCGRIQKRAQSTKCTCRMVTPADTLGHQSMTLLQWRYRSMHWRDAMNKKNQEWINDKGRKPKEIVTKPATQEYKDNWDKIFGNKKNGKTD